MIQARPRTGQRHHLILTPSIDFLRCPGIATSLVSWEGGRIVPSAEATGQNKEIIMFHKRACRRHCLEVLLEVSLLTASPASASPRLQFSHERTSKHWRVN